MQNAITCLREDMEMTYSSSSPSIRSHNSLWCLTCVNKEEGMDRLCPHGFDIGHNALICCSGNGVSFKVKHSCYYKPMQ